MKFLHTSDWHLGKIFYEHSLVEDQKHFLNQIIEELACSDKAGTPYDALVVAGDIYDKAIASPEAVTLFNEFLNTMHEKFPQLQMFFSAGNHDSATRLSFASGLLHSQNIHMATEATRCDVGILTGRGDDAAVVYQIPFLQMGSLTDSDGTVLRHQNELLAEACDRIRSAHKKACRTKKIPLVVSAHVFAGSSDLGGSERNFVGTAEQIDAKLFKAFDYTALGHIHKSQKILGEAVRYSGAPLDYNFGEKGRKVMLSVTVTGEKVDVEEIEFVPLHKVTRLEGTYDDFISGDYVEYKDDYVELICTDNLVHENPMEALRGKFPNILSFRVVRTEAAGQNLAVAERRAALEKISGGDYSKIFDLFMNDVYRSKQDELKEDLYKDEKKLFSKIAKEVEASKE